MWGMAYEPLERRMIHASQPCTCHRPGCRRTLGSGFGYYVRDMDTGREIPMGPDCFKKVIGADPDRRPSWVIDTVAGNDSGDKKGGGLSRTYGRAAARSGAAMRAQENVKLRAQVLPELGFARTGARRFQEFLPRVLALGPDDIREIELRAQRSAEQDPRRSLKQLKSAYMAFMQIERMLEHGDHLDFVKKKMRKYQDNLREYNGLPDCKMVDLRRWAATALERWGVPNVIFNISFPENERLYKEAVAKARDERKAGWKPGPAV